MTLQPRHLILAALLHVVLFLFLFVGVQCSQPVQAPPVVQGVLIAPSDLKALRPPTPPTPTPSKPEELDQGPQQIVKDTDVVADQAKQKQEQAEAEQKKLDEQKAAEQQQKDADAAAQAEKQKAEAAKAEELKRQQEVQKQADEQAAALKKQQEEAKRQADAAAAQAAADAQRKKELDDQIRKEAQQRQDAQAAAMAKQKKAEEAQHEADRRKRVEELQKQLGAESAELTAQVQNQWITQLAAAIQQAWAWPPGTDPNTKAWLKIKLSSTGQVLSADISTGSGVPLFDQTLKQAAYKASPLPLPQDPTAFDPNLNICFSPNSRSCQQQ